MTRALRGVLVPALLVGAAALAFGRALPAGQVVAAVAVALVVGLAAGVALHVRLLPGAAFAVVALLVGAGLTAGSADPRQSVEALHTFLVIGLPAGGLPQLTAVPYLVLAPAAVLATWAALGERAGLVLVGPVAAFGLAALLVAPVGVPAGAAPALVVAGALALLTGVRSDVGAIPPLVGTHTELRRQRSWWRPLVQVVPAALAVLLVAVLPHPDPYDVRRHVEPEVDVVPDQNPLAVAARWGTLEEDQRQPVATVAVDGAASPGRLRLAVLDRYEPTGWLQDVEFAVTGETLGADPLFGAAPDDVDPVAVRVEQPDGAPTFLALPTAGRPAQVEDPSGLRYAASASVLLATDDRAATTYRTVPAVERPLGPGDTVIPGYAAGLAACPENEVVRAVADQLTAGATSASERLAAIESWLLTRRVYDPSAPGGQTLGSVERFLAQPFARGNLEVLVTSYAVLARCADVPARVAVGLPAVEPGSHQLDQGDVQAWVEVPVSGAGWVAVDPVPTPEEQLLQAQLASQPPTPPTTTPEAPEEEAQAVAAQAPAGAGTDRTGLVVAATSLLVLAVVAALLLLVPAVVRRRRRRLADPTDAALAAWTTVVEALVDRGVPVEPSHTPAEVARVAAGSVPVTVPHLLAGLGPVIDRLRYGGEPATEADAAQAWAYADAILARLPEPAAVRAAPLRHPRRHVGRLVATRGVRRREPWAGSLPDTAVLDPDAVPSDIPDVAVAARIGDGATGTVYRGVHEPTGEAVAVKLFRYGPADRGFDQQRFDWEVRIARDVSGLPHLPTVLAAGIAPASGRPYLVSTLYERGTLLDRVRRGGPLTAAEARAVGVDLARALDALHQLGVVHADIKPENVFASPDGWVLGDLGSAWLRAGRGPAASLTPPYAAPEVWRGSSPTPASDLYSLALTVLFAATGQVPIAGNPPPADLVAASFPEHPVIQRALEPDARRRPRSAAELARRLEPDVAPPPALSVRTLSLPTPTVSHRS